MDLVVFKSLHHKEPHLDLTDRTMHYPEIVDCELDLITVIRIVSFGIGVVGNMGTQGCLGNKEIDCSRTAVVVPSINYPFLPEY